MAKAKDETQNTSAEPSMEEILASIRKMINDGDEEQPQEQALAPAEAKAPAAEAPAAVDEMAAAMEAPQAAEEIIELTEAAAPAAGQMAAAMEEPAVEEPVAPAAETEEMIELTSPLLEEPAAEEAPATETADTHNQEIASLTTEEVPADERLISDATDASATAAISELASAISRASLGIQSPGITLEDIVKETLKPLLKNWLDTHMTSIVEGVVRDEIERIVHKVVGRK